MKMSPAETISAATINAACALRLDQTKGSIEPGKDADIAIFNVRDYREIPYWTAANRCSLVIAGGTVIQSHAPPFGA
jgi:imidazolonepropionase